MSVVQVDHDYVTVGGGVLVCRMQSFLEPAYMMVQNSS